jgi:hypothetical protein
MNQRYVVVGRGYAGSTFEYLGSTNDPVLAKQAILNFYTPFDDSDYEWLETDGGMWELIEMRGDNYDDAVIGYAASEYDLDQNGDL